MPTGREEEKPASTLNLCPSHPSAADPALGAELCPSGFPQQAVASPTAAEQNRKRPASKTLESTNLSIVHTADSVRKRRKRQHTESLETGEELPEGQAEREPNHTELNFVSSERQGGGSTQSSPTGNDGNLPFAGAAPPPPSHPGEDVKSLMRRITMETRELLSKWQEPFKESEDFESFCLLRVEQLLKEAKVLEQSLSERKERLRQRLGTLSNTLQFTSS